jgi:DNA-binding response OmpR family regulator
MQTAWISSASSGRRPWRAAAVPILVLTGHSEEHFRARALAAGAADVLIKPFDPTRLIVRIAAAVAPGRDGTAAGADPWHV